VTPLGRVSDHPNSALDGEIACGSAGQAAFKDLLFRHGTPFFFAFDLLMLSGKDCRTERLIDRKQELRWLFAGVSADSLLKYADHVDGLRFSTGAIPNGWGGKSCLSGKGTRNPLRHSLRGIRNDYLSFSIAISRTRLWLASGWGCRRRRHWIDEQILVPSGKVVDTSCGNKHCIALWHAYLRPRIEQPGKYRKIADRVTSRTVS